MTLCASLTCESGLIPDQSMPHWASIMKLPIEITHSAASSFPA